jgi:hypothetical protein
MAWAERGTIKKRPARKDAWRREREEMIMVSEEFGTNLSGQGWPLGDQPEKINNSKDSLLD